MTTEIILNISGLTKQFGSVVAVSSVSVGVARGKTGVLLGPSGCGKTTILRCTAGLERTTDGTISIDSKLVSSRDVHVSPDRRNIGMVFQSYALWPKMSVADNVEFPLRQIKKMTRTDSKQRARDLLAQVGMAGMEERLPGQLSGGQQQRVAVARALAGDPALLLMDEPLSALDPLLRDQVRQELKSIITNSGIACLYVTHDQREALAMADSMVIMRGGKILEMGAPMDIYPHPSSSFGAHFLGARNEIHGTVVGVGEGGFCKARVSGGTVILFTPGKSWIPCLDEGVALLWRPSSMKVLDGQEDGAANIWPCRVEKALYLGEEWEVELGLFEEEKAVGQSLRPVAPGQPCFAHVDPASVFGFHSLSKQD